MFMFVCTTVLYEYMKSFRNDVSNLFDNTHMKSLRNDVNLFVQ